jgi:hypothetical protein
MTFERWQAEWDHGSVRRQEGKSRGGQANQSGPSLDPRVRRDRRRINGRAGQDQGGHEGQGRRRGHGKPSGRTGPTDPRPATGPTGPCGGGEALLLYPVRFPIAIGRFWLRELQKECHKKVSGLWFVHSDQLEVLSGLRQGPSDDQDLGPGEAIPGPESTLFKHIEQFSVVFDPYLPVG